MGYRYRNPVVFTGLERAFLEQEVVHPEIRVVLLGNTSARRFRVAATMILPRYVDMFSDPLPAESDADFHYRVRMAPATHRHTLVQRPAETDRAVDARLASAADVCSLFLHVRRLIVDLIMRQNITKWLRSNARRVYVTQGFLGQGLEV